MITIYNFRSTLEPCYMCGKWMKKSSVSAHIRMVHKVQKCQHKIILRKTGFYGRILSNWVSATNSDFLIPLSLQPNVVDLRYFTLWIRSVRLSSSSLKYQRFSLSGCKDIGNSKYEFVAKTQLLHDFQPQTWAHERFHTSVRPLICLFGTKKIKISYSETLNDLE